MSMRDQAQAFLEAVKKAVAEGQGQAAYQVGERAIDLVCDGFTEAIESSGVCEGCKDKIGFALEPLVAQLLALKAAGAGSNGKPVPMCKATAEAIAHACPTCGTMTERVDPLAVAVQGSDLGRPKFVCPKCSPTRCKSCNGKGWNKGTTPGGTRVVRIKCSECEGTGKR